MNDERGAWLPQPGPDELDIGTVLQALADPTRRQIVALLDVVGEATCTSLDLPVKVSTVSHHMKVLRESGVVSTRVDGNTRPSRLRHADLERRFPGLLTSIIRATPVPSGSSTRSDDADDR
ncbi:DNA-binding transcriptional regulator, ArsR family [Streptoalloteichus tenebrarius]|uniref:DNA-binding transcriptional regulator, ArsR family n=1 Tax=Streptoalloteichus tenebrarius (strain ATCC 17920 / DSM 40477 / JCM 4838 / CBS 697.72 / NBRC 16177 / NCIMB 11028 / NRRL B-12390 / A12253. 1 / ISP 5477) TaxID=1933 RepID=A0ABT1HLX5_STRSD|nr:metalloregulator ArsR/SmtB family transcription factor [Streptoalloteichus tenebrarius]MCP2256516.1 DNA-binding transcriptional regulator, ArsR family [Streptoalloteichus tenebrarius]BFF04867.1 helix-turn-helix transcriptional regulator [Streptoalloteichus tenebrarius]